MLSDRLLGKTIVVLVATMIFVPAISAASMATGLDVTISIKGSTITAKNSDTGKILKSGSSASSIIQSGIDAIRSAGAGTLHIRDGTYHINSPLDISRINNFVIDGDGRDTTILKCTNSGIEMLIKKGSTQTHDITIRDIQFDGNNIADKIIDIVNAKKLTITNVILQKHNSADSPGAAARELLDSTISHSIIRNPNAAGDAIAITGTGVTFQNNEVTRQAARGAGLGSGHLADSKIINNYFHDFKGYAAVSLENQELADSKYSFKNVEIAYNTFKNLDGNAIRSNGYSGSGGAFYNLNIHNNKVTNAVGHGVMLNAFDNRPNVVTYNSKIHDNTFLYTAGINVGPIKSSTINDNTIDHTANWRGYGIYLYKGSNDVTMDGNKISNTARPAYYYSGSSDIYINGKKVA